jgi:YD repeat-containing protein
MNKIITTLILAGMVLACKPKSENIKPEEETACKKLSYKNFNSLNNVVTSETYLYDNTGKLIEFQRAPKTIKYEYDANGKLLKTIEYTQNLVGVVKSSETDYTYNAANQLIKEVVSINGYASGLTKATVTFYEYHPNGKMKKKTTFSNDLPLPDSIVEYNERGEEILTQLRDGNYLKTEYNAADLIVKVTKYYPDNNQKSEQVHEYNSQNLKIKSSIFNNGVLWSYMTYEYNAKGKLITLIHYSGDGSITRKYITEYTGENYKLSQYNGLNKLLSYENGEVKNGLLMKWSGYLDNKLSFYIIYAYDSHKNMIKLEEFDSKSVMYGRQEWAYQCD